MLLIFLIRVIIKYLLIKDGVYRTTGANNQKIR